MADGSVTYGGASRLAAHDYANRAGSVGFLTRIHGAKLHIFCLATPKDTRKIPQNPCKTVGAIMCYGKVMKSGVILQSPRNACR